MQNKTQHPLTIFLSLSLASALVLFVIGCDVTSGDEVVREVGADYTGFYTNPNGRIVANNTGGEITALDLMQTGSRLQAVDNNGNIFRGNVGDATEGRATFRLDGITTAGTAGVITGTLNAQGTSATMNGTWVENALFSTVFATASVTAPPTNSVPTQISISPSGSITISANGTRAFTASGGSGSFTWTVSNSTLGRVNPTTGNSVTYTAQGFGSQTVTVSDGTRTASTTVTQQ